MLRMKIPIVVFMKWPISCTTISKGSIDVVIAEDHSNYNGYAPTLHMNLDTSKLCSLGWTASTSLTQMFVELIHWMREHKYE